MIIIIACLIFLYTVLVVESELQIKLEKTARQKMWSSLGVLLPGNAEVMPKCSDALGKNQSVPLGCLTESGT